jgi:hypothetical protein
MAKMARGMINSATNACDAGCAQIRPKVGRRRRRIGASAQWMAQRTEAATPMRSGSARRDGIATVVIVFSVLCSLEAGELFGAWSGGGIFH